MKYVKKRAKVGEMKAKVKSIQVTLDDTIESIKYLEDQNGLLKFEKTDLHDTIEELETRLGQSYLPALEIMQI